MDTRTKLPDPALILRLGADGRLPPETTAPAVGGLSRPPRPAAPYRKRFSLCRYGISDVMELQGTAAVAAWLTARDHIPRCRSCAVISPDSRTLGKCRICRGAV